MALERIVLNIIPAGEMPVFHCSQYENGRPVIIDLVSSDDDAFLVPEGATVELHCRKVDDNIVTLRPDEVDNNTITFVSTEQLTACPGDNLCEIVLYADTDPVQTIATLNFILHVEPDPLEGGLTSETQIYNITQQVEEITQQVIGDDYYDKTEVDGLLAGKADQATTYTKLEVDTALNLKADKATTYTKTQVDSALALKANSADLAMVATTGSYGDLTDKPTIPAAQVQSDYAQADNTQVDYIKNKPDINAMIAAALFEVMPVGTASGPIANFDTELVVPLVNVSCDVVATGGNGTPDNPNPINGYTEANITRCGVNLWDEEWEVGTINHNTGALVPNNSIIRSKNFIPVSGGATILLYGTSISNMWMRVFEYDKNENLIASVAKYTGSTYQLNANTAYLKFYMKSDYGTTYNKDISILYPSTLTPAYHPYTGNTYAIAFGQTVYGGVLDVTRGKLRVTHSDLIDLSSLGWSYDGVQQVFVTTDFVGYENGTPFICSGYSDNGAVAISQIHNYGGTLRGAALYLKNTDYTDKDTFKAAMSGIKITRKLATPFDIDLTPEVISAVVGTNNVYSDTNGDTTVQFKDSIQHYIDTRP